MTSNENLNRNGVRFSDMEILEKFSNDETTHHGKPRNFPSWKDECHQFAQETTLHGLKYISLKDAFIFRRVFWFALTCVCIGIMSYQIIDRVIYYYKSPISVNVKVNYNRSLVFPSVTICNQNAFKSSAAAEHNWYRLIETMYNNSKNTFNTSHLHKFNATDLRMSDLFLKTGHQKEDMIVDCFWDGEKCTHDDFEPLLADHGLCYTFKPKNTIMVRSTGSEHGLKLFLNVEQYEYMPGPNDAAGIKLLTYNESSIPRIKELGISIPTGIHAFVGLQLLVINNLPEPEGQCQYKRLNYSRHYSTDACIIECLNEFTKKRCHCRNYFIPSINDNEEECTLEKYHACYRKKFDEIHDTLQEKCDCPTACQYSIFDPVVSYASTSGYAVERKLNSMSTSLLYNKVLKSREVAHRMEKRKFNLFKELISSFELSFEDVKNTFQQIIQKISIHLGLVESRYLKDKIAWKRKIYLYKYQIYNVNKNFIRARDAMEERTLSNLCVGFHEFVFKTESNLKHLFSNETSDETARSILYTTTLDSIRSQIETTDRAYANITQLYEAYENGTPIFKYKFSRTARKHNIYIIPKKLLADSLTHNAYAKRYAPRLKTDILTIKTSLNHYKELLDEVMMTGSLNISEMELTAHNYTDRCEDFYHSKSVFYAECIERPKHILERDFENFKQYVADYEETIGFIKGNLNNLRDSLSNVSRNEVRNIGRFINELTEYLNFSSEVRKDYLADSVLSDYLLSQISQFELEFQEIRNRGQNLYDGWTDLIKRINTIWSAIIEDENMISYYKYRNYESFLVNITDLRNETRIEILDTRNTNDLRSIVGDTDKKLVQHFEDLKSHMISFKSSVKIDQNFLRENVLQIDVFYRELSYEEIDQQVAYDIFALLCDIGGSMGLFIGASVMTIFEILAFVLNLSAENAVRRKRSGKK